MFRVHYIKVIATRIHPRSPNSSLLQATRQIGDLHEVDLSSLRLIVNCSEPVRYESHENFLKRFQPYGLRPTAFSACYAMAETTFAVTQTPIGLAPTVVAVDRTSLARGKVEPVTDGVPARICVSSGKPIEGCEVRIVDENRFDVAPGSVGEIAITSATMFSGYRNYPEKTAEVLCDGWYYSGDYGFQDNGELFVIGCHLLVAGGYWQRLWRRSPAAVLGFGYAVCLTAAMVLAPDAGKTFIYFVF